MENIKLYTLKEIAEILKVSKQTIYNYIRSGKLHAVKCGKEYRITEEKLKIFIENGSN